MLQIDIGQGLFAAAIHGRVIRGVIIRTVHGRHHRHARQRQTQKTKKNQHRTNPPHKDHGGACATGLPNFYHSQRRDRAGK
jgi:hypothetical protein